MLKEGKYKYLKEALESIKESNKYNKPNEIKVLNKLNVILKEDKQLKVLENIINNSAINTIRVSIDSLITNYQEILGELKKSKMPIYHECKIISKRIEYLIELKQDIDEYNSSLLLDKDVFIDYLYDDCFSTIMGYPVMFNNFLSKLREIEKDTDFNRESITKNLGIDIDKILRNKKDIETLELGLDIKKLETEKQRIIDLCNSTKSYQTLAYENIDKIINNNRLDKKKEEYLEKKFMIDSANLPGRMKSVNNKIKAFNDSGYSHIYQNSELRDLHQEKKKVYELFELIEPILKEYDTRVLEFIDSNKKLISSGLGDLLYGTNMNLKLSLRNNPLSIYVEDIDSKEDLDTFFEEVDKVLEQTKKFTDEKLLFIKKKYENTAKGEIIKLLNDYPEISKDIVSLSKIDINGIDPKFGVFVIEMLLVLKDTPLEELNVSKKDYEEVRKVFNKLTKKDYQEFVSRYNDIVNDRVDSNIKIKK